MKLTKYRTYCLHIMLQWAKPLKILMMLDIVSGREDLKIFWIHGVLETRIELGQESEEVVFILIALLALSISKSTSVVVTHANHIFL